MPYFFSILLSIVSISTLAIFINKNIKINLNYSFLISSCLCALFIYIGYIILPIFYLKYLIYTYLIFLLFAALQIFKKYEVTKKNFNLIIEFLIITFLVSLFSWNRYYLDQDELDYWGIVLKYFHFFQNNNFDNSYILNLISKNSSFFYHEPFLPIFHFYNSFFSGFREDISIFSNNLFIISSFYFVFYNEKDSILKRFFLLIIFYVCLNNLSFGLVSIYADPIIATLYLSLIVHLFRTKDINKISDIFIIFILSISLFFIHRSGILFVLFSTYFWFIFSNYKKKKIIFFLFNIIIVFYIFQLIFIKCGGFDFKCVFFNPDLFNHFLINFLFIDIYYSDFGVSLNTIFSILGIESLILPEFDIKVIFWLIVIMLILSHEYKINLKIIFFTFFQFFFYTLIIYTAKIQIDGLSISVYGRYIGIILLSILLFCIYLVSTSIKKNNNVILSLILCFLIFITPNKTYGFFLTNNYFLKQEQNYNFWKQKQEIKKIYNMLKPNLETFIIEGSYKSKTTAYHPSMPFSLMNFEFYSKNSVTKKIKTIKFSKYIDELHTSLDGNLIFYNLTQNEKTLIKKVNNTQKHIYLNFE